MMCSQPTRGLTARIVQLLAIAVLVGAGAAGANSLRIGSKAVLAQWLLDYAWLQRVANASSDKTQTGQPPLYKPWPWADVQPVLKLEVPRHDVSLLVLDNDSGEALAFGPGLVTGNVDQLADTTLVLGGHRDTHFDFLEHLSTGDEFLVSTASGQTVRYTATHMHVVDSRVDTVAVRREHAGLVLITCWPFRAAFPGGPLRYVIEAAPIGQSAPAHDIYIENV